MAPVCSHESETNSMQINPVQMTTDTNRSGQKHTQNTEVVMSAKAQNCFNVRATKLEGVIELSFNVPSNQNTVFG